jgi:two-component system, OmpR family, response regulator RegX3
MRIAILEDDPEQAGLVATWLESAGHHCAADYTSEAFLKTVLRETFDLLMIDWMVPRMSGIEVMKRYRESARDYTPVLFVTARDAEDDIVLALQAGADDYMSKPLRRNELLARVTALARRARSGAGEQELPDSAPFVFDLATHSLSLAGRQIDLTEREFELALFMFRNAGRVLSRGHILEILWGVQQPDVQTRTVDTHISRLRKKLHLGGDSGWQLSAVYQHGYRLSRSPAQGSADTEASSGAR